MFSQPWHLNQVGRVKRFRQATEWDVSGILNQVGRVKHVQASDS